MARIESYTKKQGAIVHKFVIQFYCYDYDMLKSWILYFFQFFLAFGVYSICSLACFSMLEPTTCVSRNFMRMFLVFYLSFLLFLLFRKREPVAQKPKMSCGVLTSNVTFNSIWISSLLFPVIILLPIETKTELRS